MLPRTVITERWRGVRRVADTLLANRTTDAGRVRRQAAAVFGSERSGRQRLREGRLDGIRAIAALSVVCFHVWLYRVDRPHGRRTELLDQVLFHANAGLICFFVLSGYLLYGAFARAALTGAQGIAIGSYLRRRAARIVPAAWACGAGSLILYWAVDSTRSHRRCRSCRCTRSFCRTIRRRRWGA